MRLKRRLQTRRLLFIYLAVIALYGIWSTTKFVAAFTEERRVHIFPTLVDAKGWNAARNALTQVLPNDAPFTSFTQSNSAYLSIDSPPVASQNGNVVPTPSGGGGVSSEPTTPPPQSPEGNGGSATTTSPETVPEVAPEATSTDSMQNLDATSSPPEAVPVATTTEDSGSASSTIILETHADVHSPIVRGAQNFGTFLLSRFVTTAYAQETTTTSATTPSTPSATSTQSVSVPPPDPSVCSALGTDCHTISLSGFALSGSVTNENFQRAELNFSFGSLTPENSPQDGKLQVRYYHAGSWHTAGEVYLNQEVSNRTNGGYFTATLDDLTSWNDFSDVTVVIEYVRNGQLAPIRLFLDAAWIDAVYTSRAQDILSGTTDNTITDMPANVTQDLTGNGTSGLSVVDNGTVIHFPYLSTLANTFVLRTDKSSYSSANPGMPQTVYVSVTNTGKLADTFHLYASIPGATSTIASVDQYTLNVPQDTSNVTYQDVTYYCDSGWQNASSSTAYTCNTTNETESCSTVSNAGTNCLVSNQPIMATSTSYVGGWLSVPLNAAPADNTVVDAAAPGTYHIATVSQGTLTILPKQTLYFRVTVAVPRGGLAHFAISTVGDHYFGTVSSESLSTESAVKATLTIAKSKMLKGPLYNDELSDSNDFSVDQLPSFRFKWRTQRSLFTQLKNFLTGSTASYTVQSTRLIHSSGDVEHVPVDVSYGANDVWQLQLEKPPRSFRPGKYTIDMTISEGGSTYTDSVQFYWGVLAMNADQSVYEPNSTAHLSIAALDDNGDTVCDANLDLSVTGPDGTASDTPVFAGGGCGRNNVTTLPDYVADVPFGGEGQYTLTLSHLDDTGAVINHTAEIITVQANAPYRVSRVAQTRIYPVSAYSMTSSVYARDGLDGTVSEALPEGFNVLDSHGGVLSRKDGTLYITWNTSIEPGDSKNFSYTYKAPEVSPYLYLLGPMSLSTSNANVVYAEPNAWKIASDAIPIAAGTAWLTATTTLSGTQLNTSSPAALSWSNSADYDSTYFSYASSSPSQLVVQQDGDYLVAVSLPVTRTSAGTRSTRVEADVYLNGGSLDYAVGRSAYISNQSGQTDSSDNYSILMRGLHAGNYIEVYAYSPDTVNAADVMNITDQASLYAQYISSSQQVFAATATTTASGTNLNATATSSLYWYDGSSYARSDSNYTHSNGSSPQNITLSSAGYYLVYVNIPLSGAVTAANVRGSVALNGAVVAGGNFKQGHIANANGDTASSIHWGGILHATTTSENLSVGVLQEGLAGTLTAGSNEASIYVQQVATSSMYQGEATSVSGGKNWNVTPAQNIYWQTDDVKDNGTFQHSTVTNPDQITVKNAGDYLLVFNDSHTGAVTRSDQIISVAKGGTPVPGAETKSNYISNTSGNVEGSSMLTYFLRNLASSTVITLSSLLSGAVGTVNEDLNSLLYLVEQSPQSSYIQDTEFWYQNANSATTTVPWSTNTNQGDPITSGYPVNSGDVLRLRMALTANVTTVGGADSFKLQYAPGSDCFSPLTWTDVGATGSGSIWRGYDNAGVTAGTTLSNTDLQLTVSSTTETYEEQNPSAAAPNGITAGNDGEWDWALQDNSAPAGTDYCFRMVSSNGQVLKDYNDYPALETDSSPLAPTQITPFDNEEGTSTAPLFQFTTSDPNGENIHYEIQVSTDPNFGSTVIDANSFTNYTDFQDISTPSGRSPYSSGDTIGYTPTVSLTNGTTYYWRVRAKDPTGTNTYGSFSPVQSYTVSTGLTASAWFQTADAQFSNSDTFQQTQTSGSGQVQLIGADTVGTTTSGDISFSSAEVGTAWGSLSWNDTITAGTVTFHVLYLDAFGNWSLVPDSALSGNAAGFTSGPVVLSSLDPTIYTDLEVEAVLKRTSGTPYLNDWTVSWVLAVPAPTTISPFDDEKVATTTPNFLFSSADPQGNKLTYQVQWSTDSTFATGVSSSTSDISAGFTDTASSTATAPFPSGDTIQFHLQPGSPFTNGTTYWWRVHAKNPGGGYSVWSSPQSLTVDTSVTVSTWYQASTAQFNTDSLTLTTGTTTGVTVSSDTGKIAIYRAATAGEGITTSTFNNGWDTTVRQDNLYSLTGTTTINLNIGHYAVLYGVQFSTASASNRVDIQNSLNLGGQNLPIGWSQAFIRGSGVSLEGMGAGGGIIDVTSNSTPLKLQSFRTDTNAIATTRVANTSGIQLIKLDDTWPYLRLSKTNTQTGPTSAAWTTVTYNSNDEINSSSFSHATNSGSIVLAAAGHYLVFANTYGSTASANTTDSEVDQKLTLNGSDVEGSFSTLYMRGNTNTNGIYEGAAAIGMIIDATTTNSVLSVQISRTLGTSVFKINANSAGTYVNRSGITVVKIPEGDFIRLQNSTNTQNINPTALTALTWDTEAEKDTASFIHSNTTNPSRVQANVAGDYLLFTDNYATSTPTANSEFNQGWRLNGGTLIQYGQTIGYNDTTATHVGNWSGNIFPSVASSSYFEVVAQALGVTGNVFDAHKGVQGVRIGSLNEADVRPKTVESDDIVFANGTGPKWGSVSWNTVHPGSSNISMQVEYLNASSTYSLVPNSVIPGNSTGTTTSPISLSGVDHTVYGTLHMLATFTCVSGNCPTLSNWTTNWSAGINISGTIKKSDETTNVTSGTVAVAVNGVLTGKTGTISGGTWTIPNVTVFPNNIVTVFVSGSTATTSAVGVTKYLTTGDITGMQLFQTHLSLGSNDNPTLTNTDISQYDNSVAGGTDVFDDVNAGGNLNVCATGVSGCTTARLYIIPGTTFEPASSGTYSVTTPNITIAGTLIADANTINVSHSWRNSGTFTKGSSTVVFTATSTIESIDSTGSASSGFFALTFGQTSGTAQWNLATPLYASSTLAITYGTLAPSAASTLELDGNLSVGTNGVFTKSTATTTFSGSGTNTWTDSSAAVQDLGTVVISGTSKTIQLGSNVRATNVTIQSSETLDANGTNTAFIGGSWTNSGTFTARTGTVAFTATTGSYTVIQGSSSFNNLTFSGSGGSWNFSGSNVTALGDLTISGGSLTLASGTTTVSGSFTASGGTFANNSGIVELNASGSKTVNPGTSPFSNFVFDGSGSVSFASTNATSTKNFSVTSGSVTLPSGTLAVGGSFSKTGGSFTANNGTLQLTATTAQTIKVGNSSLYNIVFAGSGGSWSFLDANVTASSNLTLTSGAVTLPSGTLSVGGSFTNSGGTFAHNNGSVTFNATTTGFTINPGSSSFYDLAFNSSSGGWTIAANATSTHNTTLTAASSFTLASGKTLEVDGTFANHVGGSPTTWTGSTLYLNGGSYTLDAKGDTGDTYGTLLIGASSQIRMWNSSATAVTTASTASLYSMNNTGVSGNLSIWGAYSSSGSDYWDYATDFDGTALGGSSRAVAVTIASSSSLSYSGGLLDIVGSATATTTIANQGSGTYSFAVSGGTLNAQYYQIRNTDANGLSLSGSLTVSSLSNGDYQLGVNGGTMMTVASAVINANPVKLIKYDRFATSTGISSGYNVTEVGSPTSYWWFQSQYGNYFGEAHDNDPGPNSGNPGYVWWDDSAFVITVSGHVYSDHGVTPIGSPTCDGSTQDITLVVAGGSTYTASCNSGTGAYSISGVTFTGDVVFTTYLNANSSTRAVTVTKTATANITDLDLYKNALIVRHEGVTPMTITNLASYDATHDSSIPFNAATSTMTLTVLPQTELFVWPSKTFSPGGNVTLQSGGTGGATDGRLYLATSSIFVESGTQTLSIGGGLTLNSGATFTAANSSITFTATTTGKSIYSPAPLSLYNVTFSGVGGSWSLDGPSGVAATTVHSITLSAGTLIGTGDLVVQTGGLSGATTISLTGGTVETDGTGNLGASAAWQFNNLVIGNGIQTATTTETGSATTTILGTLTVASGSALNAGSSPWVLSGGGTPLVTSGSATFNGASAAFSFTATSAASIFDTTYGSLTLAPSGSGTPTYTLQGGAFYTGNFTIGNGTYPVSVTADTNDPSIAVSGTMLINSGATFTASNVGALNFGGSFTNAGTFVNSNGSVTFNATTTGFTINPGSSSFYDLAFNSSSGGWTIAANATSTHNTTLTAASSFTLASGKTLEVDGTFANHVGGSPTTWTGSTLYLNGGSYTLDAKGDTGDTYGTLLIGASSQIRMWNSSATAVTTASTASLYSMNNTGVSGNLSIWGAYSSSGSDYWDYATDFDGTALGGSSRAVAVTIASSSSLSYSGGLLDIVGSATATTTIANQGSGTYSFAVSGGTLNAQYYQIRNTDANGLSLSGSLTVSSLSNGDYQLGVNGGTMMTVASAVINANPLAIFVTDRFATSTGISSGYNVTEVGSPSSYWKFNKAYGNYYGEAYDNDPGGDPGYIVWDNSASQITVSGNVYSDEGVTVSGACDGSTPNVKLVDQGSTSYTAACNASTGAFSISGVSYNPGDTLTLYLVGSSGKRAANVTVSPATNITSMNLYENRVIVREEGASPITIANMSVCDSRYDSAIPFTALTGSPNTLTLPANTKLIVWTGMTFAPVGNVTIQAGGGTSYDGSIEIQTNGTFSASGTQTHTIGGNFALDSGASLVTGNSTFVFNATTTGKTIGTGSSAFYNATFSGAGGAWLFTGANATTTNNFSVSAGTVTLPSGTLAVGGSFINSGGAFSNNSGTVKLTSTASGNTIQANSAFNGLTFSGVGGSWSFTGANATTSSDFNIATGTVTLPAGTLSVGGSFTNTGTFSHNNGTVNLTSTASGKSVTAGGSSFSNVIFAGSGGAWTFTDTNATVSRNFTISAGSVTFPTGAFLVGGSFTNAGTFVNSGGGVTFNATTTGFTINPGSSSFYDLAFNSSSGGWTIAANATSTHNTTLTAASSFTLASGKALSVGGTFANHVGGSPTTWTGSTLFLNSGTDDVVNAKTDSGDTYGTLVVGATTHVRMWNSSAATTSVNSTGSLYSMNNAGVPGNLSIWGTYVRSSGSDYWDYATDFDGTALSGSPSPRAVAVTVANSSSISFTGGLLDIVGTASATTTIANQGSGTYAFAVSGGTLNAQYYQIRNTDANGLSLSGSLTVSSLSNGDYQLGVNGGTMVTVTNTVVDTNANLSITGDSFATSTGISSGYNVTLTGTPNSAWTFTTNSGNYSGEAYDSDGGDACGHIRWPDSSCLFVNQAHYRWRADNGGEGALSSTWYNASWNYREKIGVTNSNAISYTNYPIKITVPYDASMNSNFSDLRFTDSSGTTLIPYWKESTTNSSSTVVWVNVPSLPASGSATIYVYFGNNAATAADSGSSTFQYFEDFESGSLSGYSGSDASLFNVGTSFAYTGTYGLDAGSNTTLKTSNGGIYKTGTQTTQGDTIRYFQYVDASHQDEPCTFFGVQSAGNNYAICLEEYPSQAVYLMKNVKWSDSTPGAITLASTTASYTTGWYQVSIDWLTDNSIHVTIYNSSGSVFTTLTATDNSSPYTSGGMGFSFWDQHGGWDFYSVRQYAASAPTTVIGAKQDSNGATWLAAEDTALTGGSGLTIGQVARLRFSVQNTGAATSKNLQLQVAPLGASPNCSAVSYGSYSAVPTATGGCGTGVACMATSTNVTDHQSTAGLLTYPASMGFSLGEETTDPSNQANSLSLANNSATEVEYAFKMTSYAIGNAYCFRTTDAGSSLDNYSQIAQAQVAHAPYLTNLMFNSNSDISLTEGTTTPISVSATVTDGNGYQDISFATTTMYRSAVGASCSPDDNNCYQIASTSCALSSCSGNSCSLSCSANLQYFSDPTDSGTYAAQNWLSSIAVQDSTGLRDTETAPGVEMLTMLGLNLTTNGINFGSLTPGGNTAGINATTTIVNTGNKNINVQLSGTDLSGGASTIAVGEQKYATSTFVYGSCSVCQALTGSATNVAVNVSKPTSSSTPSKGDLYWGIDAPLGSGASVYSGVNTFTAVSGP